MARDYIDNMQRMENECQVYLQKADIEFEQAGAHTKEEGRYLQEAAKVLTEMAQVSDGAMKTHYQRRCKEVTARIEAVLREVSPDVYQRIMIERNRKASSNRGDMGNTTAPVKTGVKKDSKAIDEQTVLSWFKDSPRHSFESVSGMSELKSRLRACIADTKLSGLRKYLNMSQVHSFFFIGPPGCGKTYIIESLAHELMEKEYKYISLDGSNILSRYVGDAEKIITRLFEEAENNAPCIVFIDEIDGVCRNRSLPDLPVWASSMTTAFLTSYNRINSSDKEVIFIGATNYPNRVDDAMLDRVQLIRVTLPDSEALEYAYRKKFDDLFCLEEGFTYKDMVRTSVDYNYRDIDHLCEKVKELVLNDVIDIYPDENEAIEALKNGEYVLTRELFAVAQSAYTPSPKDAIKKELDDWEARYNRKVEEKG